MRLSVAERLVLAPFGALLYRWSLLGLVFWLWWTGRVTHPLLVLLLAFVTYDAPNVAFRRLAHRIMRATERGAHAETLALVERLALASEPLDPGMSRLYFDALVDASEMEKARAVLADAGNMGGPETTDRRLSLARDWLLAGDGALATELLGGLGNLPFPDQEVAAGLARAEAHLLLDRAADARAALPTGDAIAKLGPDMRGEALALSALVAAALGDPRGARAMATEATDLARPGHPRHPVARVALSWAAVEDGEDPEAHLTALEPLEGRLPPTYRAMRQLLLARAHERRGDAGKDAARGALAAALALPLYPFAKRRADELAARIGPVSARAAIECARDLVSRAERVGFLERLVVSKLPLRTVGWGLIALGAFSIERGAVTAWLLKPLVVLAPALAIGWLRLRHIRQAPWDYFNDRKYDETLAFLDLIDETDVDGLATEFLELRSFALQRLGEVAPQRRVLALLREDGEQQLPLVDWPADVRLTFSLWYASSLDPHRTIEMLRGMKLDEITQSQQSLARGVEGNALSDLGRMAEARPLIERAVDLAEDPVQRGVSLVDLAMLQLEMGEADQARATAKQADELVPDTDEGNKMLVTVDRALIELSCGGDGDAWLARLAVVEPQLATYFPSTRGRFALAQALAHHAAGRTEQARPLVTQALAAPMQDGSRRRAEALAARMA